MGNTQSVRFLKWLSFA